MPLAIPTLHHRAMDDNPIELRPRKGSWPARLEPSRVLLAQVLAVSGVAQIN
jgi:hypothetical protein